METPNIIMIIREKIPSINYDEIYDEDVFVCKDCKLINEPCNVYWCKSGLCCCEGHTQDQD